ncbi:MAG: biliverdin-producing heme oxygenase, partial [Phycisphaerales bacterium]|nr:biliverdin-producing heme oxygenase [Phycisphaerales bacterium]
MPLCQALKDATAQAHRHAESRTLQRLLIRGECAEQNLVQYLAQLRLIHAELERLFDLSEDAVLAIGWCDAYRHSRRLHQDLVALGIAPNQIEPNTGTQRLLSAIQATVSREPASLLGFFYV